MDGIESAYQRIWITRGARFIAHSNYLAQNKCSNFTVAILSVYIIVLSCYFISPTLKAQFNSEELNLVILAASLLTLLFSQIESSKDYKLKADKLHRNGIELTDVYDEILFVRSSTESLDDKLIKIEKILKKYNQTIQKCDENHNTYDYEMFILKKRKDLNIKRYWIEVLLLNIFYYVRIRIYFFLWIITPIFIFALVTMK
jgi:hypothetical protein